MKTHPDWRTVLAIDHDAKACEVYRANIAADRVICGEVRDHLDALPYADVIIGGPPCQPYSSAGKGLGEKDDRDCIPDFYAAVERVKPRQFLMEEVDSFATDAKFQPVLQRTCQRLTAAGYILDLRILDAVNYGTPQFRKRAWLWGIRADLVDVQVRRRWPAPTHAWPWPEASMFGGELLPAVVVGEALELDGWTDRYGRVRHCSREQCGSDFAGVYDAQNDRVIGADTPCGTIQGNAQAKGGSAGHYAIKRARQRGAREVVGVEEPSCSLSSTRSDEHYLIQSHADPARTIDQPAPALRSGGSGHDGCRVELYRWSDEMRAKHPPASPASPASPAPTVQAKWAKGGAEGLLAIRKPRSFKGAGGCDRRDHPIDEPAPLVDGRHGGSGLHAVICGDGRDWTSRHPIGEPEEPNPTLRGRSPRDSGRCVEGVVRDGLRVRRLTPLECARLQGLPGDFVCPPGVAKTHLYRIFGNGWAANIAKSLSCALRSADQESRTVIDLFCGGGCGVVGWHGRAWEYKGEGRAAG